MNCPVCNVNLTMTERQGVEIDYCPQCRGVWLDRGELDKLIERSASQVPPLGQPQPTVQPPPAARPQTYSPPPQQHGYRHRDHDDDDDRFHYERKKRRGFLGEIFDFV